MASSTGALPSWLQVYSLRKGYWALWKAYKIRVQLAPNPKP